MEPATSVVTVQAESSDALVLRNTVFLLLAQVVGTPLSVLVNAVMARHLGPEDFGYYYLASTLTAFGFLLVEWGQSGTLPALVAQNRARAGEFLGSSLALRALATLIVYATLAAGCFALGYRIEFQTVLALVALGAAIGTLSRACQDAIRGFERTDIAALSYVGAQLLSAALIVPTLLLGGRLHAALLANAAAAAIVLMVLWRGIRPAGIDSLSFRMSTATRFLSQGLPFLFLAINVELQPTVDAVFLSKLAPAQVVGWYAVSRKLVGVLVFPSSALISSLYPTLCRLYETDRDGFARTARTALKATIGLVVPIALGCALFAELGIRIFNRDTFGPAQDNLRVQSIFILLVYFTMTLGTSLAAAGLQRSWALVQFLCVVVSFALDPWLVPLFQSRWGNGGLGICVATVASEVLMLVAGIWILPRGIIERSLLRTLACAAISGGAMAASARLLSSTTPFVAAPVSVAVYAGCMFATGGFNKEQLAALSSGMLRKTVRR